MRIRAGLAFLAGVFGAAAGLVLLWLARWAEATPLNPGLLLGSLLTLRLGPASWMLGVVTALTLGGLVAIAYAGIFQGLRRARWWLGGLLGAVHALVTGALLAALPWLHPLVPEAIDPPGFLGAAYGGGTVAVVAVLHLLYGVIVGGIYRVGERPARSEPLTPEEPAARP